MGGAIFGTVSLGKCDQADTRNNIDGMKNALSRWGPDGHGDWVDDYVGLGQTLLYNTPEAVNDTLPRPIDESPFVLTAEARIDNRNDLFCQLNVPSHQQAEMPDSELISLAYQKWGTDCPDYLLGDWSFAIWDSTRKRIFVARDHYGLTSLYYYRKGPFFAFASSKGALLSHPEIPRELNPRRIIQTLVVWKGMITETEYKDIYCLPPAHALEFSTEGVNVWRYWRLEDTEEVHLSSDREYVEQFLEIYGEAVRCRLRSHRPVCATLSGGLDSSSICALAARELRKTNDRLTTFTSVPLFDTSDTTRVRAFGDETPNVKATAKFAGNIDPQSVDAASISPMDAINKMLEIHDAPHIAPANYHWLVAIQQAAQEQGFGAVLTGQSGNGGVSWAGFGAIPSYWSFLTDGRYFRAARAMLLRFVPKIWRKKIIQRHFNRQLNSRFDNHDQPWLDYSAINPKTAIELKLGKQIGNLVRTTEFTSGREKRLNIIRPKDYPATYNLAELAGHFGQEYRDPTGDKRVLEFCLSVPNSQYTNHGHGDRWLIRSAMQGLLPNKVRLTSSRGKQSADIGRRVAQNQNEIRSCLIDLKESVLASEVLDLDRMESILTKTLTIQSAELNDEIMSILLRGIGTGVFVSEFDGRLPTDCLDET